MWIICALLASLHWHMNLHNRNGRPITNDWDQISQHRFCLRSQSHLKTRLTKGAGNWPLKDKEGARFCILGTNRHYGSGPCVRAAETQHEFTSIGWYRKILLPYQMSWIYVQGSQLQQILKRLVRYMYGISTEVQSYVVIRLVSIWAS